MNVVISGSSGLIGQALIGQLREKGHSVVRLVRGIEPVDGSSRWDPKNGVLDPSVIDAADAVINLSGENIAGGRWNEARKARIRDSRLETTGLLARVIAESQRGPGVFLSASAIGYYGHRPKEELTEASSRGEGFLSDVCVAWEAAAHDAGANGARVACMRTGLVLSKDGGALPKMLLPFKAGLGGPVGNGDQVMSWISLDDLVRACLFALESKQVIGPFNATCTGAVTNREFTKVLGNVLNRPAVIPVPEFVLKTTLGEMAEELLLSSALVIPETLQKAGFEFLDTDLKATLQRILA